MNTLELIQDWYISQCDGDWEHGYGIVIETLDNPGWSVSINITKLVHGDFEQVQSKKNGTSGYSTYADSFSYNAAGPVTAMQLGNGHWETSAFNDRLQVTQIGLGNTSTTQDLLKLDFEYTGPNPTTNVADKNNGSLRKQTITVPAVGTNASFAAIQAYDYDSLNRIQSATETVSSTQTWKQTFSYDRFGNRTFDAANTTTLGTCSTTVCNPTISTSNNRFSSGQGYSYDADGAVTQDATGQRFGYDQESRQREFFTSNNSGSTPDATYFYDGNGLRVKKISATETTVFVYDASSQLAAEYSDQQATNPQVSYLTTDHLGSPRIVTDQNGAVVSRKDFTAFGEAVASSQRLGGPTGNGYDAPNVRQDYTGYQKDGESGLEYASARYFNAGHGRFTSPDPLTASATIRNPQSLNRYSYVLNSPFKFSDPLGLFPMGGGGCSRYGGTCYQVGGDNWWDGGGGYHPSLLAAPAQIHQTAADGRAGRGQQPTTGQPVPPPPTDGTNSANAPIVRVLEPDSNPTSSGPSPVDNSDFSILLVWGDSGLGTHSAGRNFQRAADTRAEELRSMGFEVIEAAISTVNEMRKVMDFVQGWKRPVIGLEFFGHGTWDKVYIGETTATNSNLTSANLGILRRLDSLEYIHINACYTGWGGSNSIASQLSSHLGGLEVRAMTGASIFSSKPDRITSRGVHPDTGPTYMVNDGGKYVYYKGH